MPFWNHEQQGYVLVLDDERRIRDLTGRALTIQGFECRAAADAVEALDVATREALDITVSDIYMPGRSWRVESG
jgi:CheY-like chemotaxis protein